MSKPNNLKGPKLFKRDENGLLESHQYIFKEDGSVDWRAMVSEDHLYPNRDWFESRNKEVPTSVAGLEDKQLLITLAGIRHLAKLRGYNHVDFDLEETSDQRVVAKCTISFIENYEEPETVYTDVANATLHNTDGFARKFLETIAVNRAFVRCVRAYLNIPIVGADEIDKSEKQQDNEVSSASFGPQATLANKAAAKGYGSFDEFKEKLREWWQSGDFKDEAVKEWKSFDDIPPKQAKTLISLVVNA